MALPDPGELFTPAALTAVHRVLADLDSHEGEELVEELQDDAILALESVPFNETDEQAFAHQAPPPALVATVVDDEDDLRQLVAGVELRWRADVALALEDIKDSLR